MPKKTSQETINQIIELRKKEYKSREIRDTLKVSYLVVLKVLKENNLNYIVRKLKNKPSVAAEMVQLRKNGMSVAEVADKFNVCVKSVIVYTKEAKTRRDNKIPNQETIDAMNDTNYIGPFNTVDEMFISLNK